MPNDKAGRIRRILVYVLFLNWLVALVKLILGYAIDSNSIVADGYHSFSDGTSNIIGLLGIWFAFRPRDKSHPYGHKKYETFASLGIGFLLFVLAFQIIKASIYRFSHLVAPDVGLYSLVVIFGTVIINALVMTYEYRAGKALNSDILVSDSRHTRSDILVSFSVIAALIAVRAGWPLFDPLAALLISGLIAHTGYEILKDGSSVLCDSAVIDTKKIAGLVMGVSGVSSVHNIRTRGRCDDVYVDLHVLVPADMPIHRAHSLSYKIERRIKEEIEGVSDVIVHMEPESAQG
ncbi:MAG: cation diffusion facilitator family transporter [Candidatus Omnitrophota bacterium]